MLIIAIAVYMLLSILSDDTKPTKKVEFHIGNYVCERKDEGIYDCFLKKTQEKEEKEKEEKKEEEEEK